MVTFETDQQKKKKKKDKAFVDLNLVLYGTFSASILKFQLFSNSIPKSVTYTRHGRHLKSQTIVVMGSDWIGRGIAYNKYNSSLGRTFMSETWVSILQRLQFLQRYQYDFVFLITKKILCC